MSARIRSKKLTQSRGLRQQFFASRVGSLTCDRLLKKCFKTAPRARSIDAIRNQKVTPFAQVKYTKATLYPRLI